MKERGYNNYVDRRGHDQYGKDLQLKNFDQALDFTEFGQQAPELCER